MTLRRMPRYEELTDEERKREYAKEKNLTMYLSSAYWSDHWSYDKCKSTFNHMLTENSHQFVCSFPYQLSIEEGLLDPELVADDMAEPDFSEVKFGMEMMALFWGSDEDAFFQHGVIDRTRRIVYPMLPSKYSIMLGNSSLVRIPPKQNGEVRILSADIALMSSKKNKNDATAIFINQMKPTKSGRYISNIVYSEAYEGLRTDDQALIIRKLFDEFSCDYLVLDCAGVGSGVFDSLSRDMSDLETGEIYPALSCCNNAEMAARCTVIGARKAIWAIKASAQSNSDMAFRLREGFNSGRIRLLVEGEKDETNPLKNIPKYKSLSPIERERLTLPYINTGLLIEELVKLQHDTTAGKIRLRERSGMRKDRYSSLAYNFYVATQLETKLERKYSANIKSSDMFIIRPPKYTGKAVSNSIGKKANKTSSAPSWTTY